MSYEANFDRLAGIVGDFERGTVSLVGAGPGEGTLISVHGAARLVQADVVLYDERIAPELLEVPPPDAERIAVGESGTAHLNTQEEVHAALVRHARAQKRVVRLVEGDPFILGQGGEACAHLAASRIPFEVVPGITAALGAPVTAGIPLTHRGLSRTLVVAGDLSETDDPDALDFDALARMDTIVFCTPAKDLAVCCERLIEAGLDVRMPAAVIQRGTSPQQRTIVGTVGDIADRAAEEGIDPQAITLIGPVVRLRESIASFEERPLYGQTIAVTRTQDQAASVSGPLRAAGAEVIEAPTIEVAEMDDFAPLDRALQEIEEYAWLVLTSVNGVEAAFKRIEALAGDSRWLAGVKVAAIGSATAARLREHGIRPDLVPMEAVGEAMADALIGQGVSGQRILLLRAETARLELPTALANAGARCDDIAAYRTVCPAALPAVFLERFDRGEIDWITLTSPSSLHNLLALLGTEGASRLPRCRLASIGPVTTRAIREAGLTETVEADPHDAAGLTAAILSAQTKR